MKKFVVAFFSLLFLVGSPASAAGSSAQTWVVTQLSGDARVVRPGLQPASLSVRAQLAPGDKLVTGPTGRATLVKGADYIVVAPRSEMRVPTAAQPTGFTRVIQTLGTLLFKVQHTGVPHFAVDTPMLAAVVKGTTFSVTVDQQRSAIQVTQGLVQVSANDGGMTRFVEGGKTVYVNHLAPKVLLDADKPLPASASASAMSVTVSTETDTPLNAIATLTSGLVRADLNAQPAIVAASTPVPETVRATATAQSTSTAGATTAVATTTAAVSTSTAAPAAPSVTASTTVPTAATAPISATVTPPATPAVTASTPVVTVAVTTPSVAATVATPLVSTSPASIPTPNVTPAAVTMPTVTVPTVATQAVSNAPITLPVVMIGSNSGPGSLNSGSNRVPGNLNSGPGNSNSGPGNSNSGPGSMNSGPNSGPGSMNSGPSVTVAAISTPTVTVPAVTAPVVPITTPTVTVPAITTPAVSVTVPSILPALKL